MPASIILTSGTRGDVQPLLALAGGMRQAGCAVRVVTQPHFGALVEQRGLAFGALSATPSELLGAPGYERALLLGSQPVRGLWHTARFVRHAGPLFERMLHSAWQHSRTASSLVLTLPTAAWGLSIAEALDIPAALALLQPVGATGLFPSPLAPFRRSLGSALNRLSHAIVERSLWLPWRAAINRWRVAHLGLAPLPRGGPFAVLGRNIPVVYGISPHVVPPPPDWPDWRVVAGYWFLDRPPGWQAPAQLERFLERGPAPVYVGFGSMGLSDGGQATTLIHALRLAGYRGVLALNPPPAAELLGDDMFVIGPTWHDWLFERVALVVHHGGAGTTAAALRAGVPAVIAPVGVDQYFWAARLALLGCGVDAGSLRTLTAERLAHALRQAAAPRVRAQAQALSALIAGEHGLQRALHALEAVMQAQLR
jgi:UDP:flavonoid glycosyltransferase YjiC (YdhE family)